MSFLQVTLKEACWDQQIFLPPAGIEPGTLSTRSQCANHSATSLPPFKLRISESVCLFKKTGEYLEKRSYLVFFLYISDCLSVFLMLSMYSRHVFLIV